VYLAMKRRSEPTVRWVTASAPKTPCGIKTFGDAGRTTLIPLPWTEDSAGRPSAVPLPLLFAFIFFTLRTRLAGRSYAHHRAPSSLVRYKKRYERGFSNLSGEHLRTLSRRSSENLPSTHSGE
jgi:hypothetical protein